MEDTGNKKGTKRTRETEKSRLTLFQWLSLLTVLFAFAVLIWGYNLSKLKTIEYEGLTRYSEKELSDILMNFPGGSNTCLFYLRHTLLKKMEIPFIETYEVLDTGRESVTVMIHEKLVTGCVQIMGRYMYFDKDGVVVESSPERIPGIPLICGLQFDEIVLYETFTIQKQSLFSQILNITRLLLLYEIPAEKVFFDANYEVSLTCGTMEVLLGKRTVYDEQLSALSGILNVAQGKYGTLDMRNYSKENQDVILK